MLDDISQTFGRVADNIVQEKDKGWAKVYKPAGRVVLNLCTLPPQLTGIVTGTISAAVGAIAAVCLGKDVKAWASEAGHVGAAGGFAFGAGVLIAVPGGIVSGLALIITAGYFGAKGNSFPAAMDKAWRNSCTLVAALFPIPGIGSSDKKDLKHPQAPVDENNALGLGQLSQEKSPKGGVNMSNFSHQKALIPGNKKTDIKSNTASAKPTSQKFSDEDMHKFGQFKELLPSGSTNTLAGRALGTEIYKDRQTEEEKKCILEIHTHAVRVNAMKMDDEEDGKLLFKNDDLKGKAVQWNNVILSTKEAKETDDNLVIEMKAMESNENPTIKDFQNYVVSVIKYLGY